MKEKRSIAIDGRMYSHSGIGRYIRMLVSHMGQVGKERPYRFVVFSPERFCQNGFDHAKSRSRPLSFWEQVDLGRYNLTAGLDLFHSPQFNIPLFSGTPQVTTIHDCAYAKYPEEFSSPADRLLHTVMFRLAIKRSRKIITVSQATKDDLAAMFRIPEDKLRVVHQGVDHRFWQEPKAEEAEVVKAGYGIHGDYLLYVGVTRPRKNVDRILRAFAALRDELPTGLKLVVAGPEDRRFLDIRKRAQDLGVAESVVLTGAVTDGELRSLYRSALCLVFPTLYEGFGLPILEAMASGTPVITSERPAHREVAGEAALFVDPLEISDLTQAMVRIVNERGLREELSEKGLARARMFSWERCARQTLSVYEEVLNG